MSEQKRAPVVEMNDATIGSIREPDFTLLESVNWTALAGEFWVVAGRQHSGKSDFLMVAAGLMAPVKGNCHFFGGETKIRDEARLADRLRLGFVFENGQLFNHLTIAENVALPLQYHRHLEAGVMEQTVRMLLDLMELSPLTDITPANVSGNWIKRAALARALALKPEVLLLDNPLKGLDARHSVWWLHFLNDLWRGHEWNNGRQMTLIVTTDDLRPWRNGALQFACLKEKKFIPLGSWSEMTATDDPVIKELLATPFEMTI
jgi:phospholipid/cholesterol/gamma-HCH transport system ATP-binding protein